MLRVEDEGSRACTVQEGRLRWHGAARRRDLQLMEGQAAAGAKVGLDAGRGDADATEGLKRGARWSDARWPERQAVVFHGRWAASRQRCRGASRRRELRLMDGDAAAGRSQASLPSLFAFFSLPFLYDGEAGGGLETAVMFLAGYIGPGPWLSAWRQSVDRQAN